ncbi:MAG: hypothetical protein AAF333_14260 [Planctomycetota bacterium]
MDSGVASRPPFRGATTRRRRDTPTPLRELARRHFRQRGRDLTPPEVRLYDAVEADGVAKYIRKGTDEDRTLPAAALEWLCTDPKAKARVGRNGIRLYGAQVAEEINLDWINVRFPLDWKSCDLLNELSLMDARLGGLFCDGSSLSGLNTARARIAGSIHLRAEFQNQGHAQLSRVTIGGDLDCSGGRFRNTSGEAIIADGAQIIGSVFLNAAGEQRFHASGEVRMLGAAIGGILSCGGGQFENASGDALSMDRAQITGSVFLNAKGDHRFHANGKVRMLGATIGSALACSGGRFENAGSDALSIDGAQITGGVYLNAAGEQRFHANGKVRVLNASIGGNLECGGGRFENAGGDALSADRAQIAGSVFLKAQGEQHFYANGDIRLLNAYIGGNLRCNGGRFEGNFSLQSARIDGIWIFRNLWQPTSPTGNTSKPWILDLTSAHARVVVDDAEAYGRFHRMFLGGFTYDGFAAGAPTDSRTRLVCFIQRQRPERLANPQPYEQLATVLRRAGHRRDAEEVLIAHRRAERRELGQKIWAARFERQGRQGVRWLASRLYDFFLGYGYRWSRPFWWSVGIVLVSSILFGQAYEHDGIAAYNRLGHVGEGPYYQQVRGEDGRSRLGDAIDQRQSEWYPSYSSLVFALDVYVPLVDLEQTKYWQPISNRGGWSRFATWLMRFNIVAGWVFTTLFVGGLATMVRREGGDSSG